jgi:NifU-like protein involved in Fe-S cluster formation
VCDAQAWTNGCSVSKNCVEAAALLAHKRTAEEVATVTMMTIMDHTGQLPDSHLHCAQLAETTLRLAARSAVGKEGPIIVSGL